MTAPVLVTGTLAAFTFPFEIAGETVQITVPAGVQVTFPMPAAQISFLTGDSNTTIDTNQAQQ